MTTEIIEKSFAVGSPARLSLKNIRGSATLRPGPDGEMTVTAVKHLETGQAERTEVALEQAGDGQVAVATRFPGGPAWLLLGGQPCRVDYDVRLPRLSRVMASGVSAALTVEGLEGEIHLSTVSGQIDARGLRGSIRLDTVSGAVIGERLSGRLHLRTVSGGANLAETDLPAIDASTVSGQLEFDTPLGEGPYRFGSVSGDVRLVVPEGSACTVEFSSLSGRCKCDLPMTRGGRRGSWSLAEVQGGGPVIRYHSVSGHLWLLSAGDSAAPDQPRDAAFRRDLLDRLAQGQVSVEQALAALTE